MRSKGVKRNLNLSFEKCILNQKTKTCADPVVAVGQVQRLATWHDQLSVAAAEGGLTGNAPGPSSGQIPGQMGSSCVPGVAAVVPVSSAGRKGWNLLEAPNPRITAAPDWHSMATFPTRKELNHITIVEKQKTPLTKTAKI